jgi:predicted transcriptional regulator of viral defense system
MNQQSHSDRLLELVRQKGLLRPSDLDQFHIPRVYLTRLTANGELEKAGRGLYKLPESITSENNSLAIIARRVPQAVFCLLSALQFHELTTQLPRQLWIALPRGSHAPKIDYPPIKLIRYSGDTYTEGIETHTRDQVTLKVYGVAKTIADCFKHRNKIGLDVAIEALREARAKKKIHADDIWRYAKICRVANVMRPYLEAIE